MRNILRAPTSPTIWNAGKVWLGLIKRNTEYWIYRANSKEDLNTLLEHGSYNKEDALIMEQNPTEARILEHTLFLIGVDMWNEAKKKRYLRVRKVYQKKYKK